MDDSGKLTIYKLQNTADPGYMPSEKLVKVEDAFYARTEYGVTRIYAALGADRQFDAVVRVFGVKDVENGMYAILQDGHQYRIDVARDISGSDDMELTLIRVEDYLDVDAE